jgi:hypothetical protein
MNEIGGERLEAAAQIAERLGNERERERRPRSRRAPAGVSARPNPVPADRCETSSHSVDSLA